MACNLTRGRLKGCREGIAGVKALYLANHDPAQTFTETSGELTDTGSALTIYRYDIKSGAGSFIENINVNIENHSVFYEQVATMTLFGLDKDDRAEFLLMAKADLFVFIEDFNGNIKLMGRQSGAFISAGEDSVGRNPGDRVGIEITLTAREPELADYCENAGATPFVNWSNITVTAGA